MNSIIDMNKIKSIAFLIVLNLATFDNVIAQSLNATVENKIDSLLAKHCNSNAPGMTVLVVQNGQILLQRNCGLASLEYKVPITQSTVFDIASLSKQFTGMAISILIEQDKIDLQEDIHKYIPELPDFGYRITVDHLIHHTSGIRDWARSMMLAGWQMTDALTFERVLNMAFNQKELNFEPGSEYSYSNTEYALLAEIVHRVTGSSFRDWTDSNIFQPLGMKDTHFYDDFAEVIANKANGYELGSDGKFRTVNNSLSVYGSSSLFTTNDDLAKWIINLDNPNTRYKTAIERMFQSGTLANGRTVPYGFGLGIGNYRGLQMINHSGSWASFKTFMAHFPEQHVSFVTVMNYTPSDVVDLTLKIVDIYFANILEPKTKNQNNSISTHDSINLNVPSKQEIGDFVGDYKSDELEIILTIANEDGKLVLKHWRNGTINLSSANKDNFMTDKLFMQAIEFYRNDKGQVIGLKISDRYNKQEARSRNQRFVKININN